MTLKEDIAKYIDGNGLVAPQVQEGIRVPGMRGSDNGVLHTARYVLLQLQNDQWPDKVAVFRTLACIDKDGYLQRAPGMDEGNAVDDHYGFFSLMLAMNITSAEVKFKLNHLHPMLIYMRAMSRGGVRRLLARAFSPIMAIIVALSNRKAPSFPTEDTSDRLLTWNIIEGLKNKSILINLAGKLWRAHQRKLYGENPSAEIFRRYYTEGVMHNYVRS
jgi:hypothetical protein